MNMQYKLVYLVIVKTVSHLALWLYMLCGIYRIWYAIRFCVCAYNKYY